jgi:hypothetical protein
MRKQLSILLALAVLSACMICRSAEAGFYSDGIWTSNEINVQANMGGSPFEPLPSSLRPTANSSADIHMTLNGFLFTDQDVYVDVFSSTGQWVNVGQFPRYATYRYFNFGKEGRLDAQLWNGLFLRAGYGGEQTLPSFEATLVVYGLSGSVSTVPIPGAVWLLGSGLFGLVGLRKLKK